MKKKTETLVILEKHRIKGKYSFPLPISPRSIEVERTPENEQQCHITCLIIPILRAQGNRILIIDKCAKEKKKNPATSDDTPIFDVLGGHYSSSDNGIPLDELNAGELSYDRALEQAFRELTEEIRGRRIPCFEPDNLMFLGFAPYESATNNELSLVFGIFLDYPSYHYQAFDDYVTRDGSKQNIELRIESFSCEELMRMKNDSTQDFRIADGLGRLLENDILPKLLRKMDVCSSGKADVSVNDRPKACDVNALLHILNMGALDFTYTEKRAFYLMGSAPDLTYGEIAETLGVKSPITINSMRQRFDKQVDKAKAILALNDFLRPKRTYKKAKYKELMPVLSEDGRMTVTGFSSKSELHDANNPLPHATVITMVWKRNAEGVWRVLMADKANRFAVATNSLEKTQLLDFVGSGHIEIADLVSDSDPDMLADLHKGKTDAVARHFIGKQLTDKIFKRAALREFQEEVKIRSVRFTPSFFELCDSLPFNGPVLLPFGGYNREIISKVYLVILPQSLNEQNLRVHERHEDSTNQSINSEHVANFFTFDELESLYKEDKDNFLDGCARFIEAVWKEPLLKTKMFSLLDKKEKTIKQKTERRK